MNIREAIAKLERELAIAPALGVDTDALYGRVSKQLLNAPDELKSFSTAVRHVALAYPDGHLFIAPEGTCGTDAAPWGSSSRIGACTQPYKDHAIVSYVGSDNPLGLRAGDEIVAVNGKSGADMMRASLEQPLCTNASASASNQRYVAATSLFASVRVGAQVKVRHSDGREEDRSVAALASRGISCRDTFARNDEFVARATTRPDGVAVIRVPSFYKQGVPPEQVYEATRQEILQAFQSVRSAPTIVWDLRANAGGSSLAGMAIISGARGDAAGKLLAAYDVRAPGTTQYNDHYDFEMEAAPEFAYRGKVAVLIDGLTISAGDYTALAAKRFGVPLVGAPASASYGGGVEVQFVGAGPRVMITPDPFRGLTLDGTPLEGKSVEPDFAVELTPADLAAGIDTVLEAGIAHAR